MLLASVSQRCYFSAEMSHRREALGAVHHHRRSPRHVRPDVREGSTEEGGEPVPDAGEGARVSGISSAATDLPRSTAQGREADCD